MYVWFARDLYPEQLVGQWVYNNKDIAKFSRDNASAVISTVF